MRRSLCAIKTGLPLLALCVIAACQGTGDIDLGDAHADTASDEAADTFPDTQEDPGGDTDAADDGGPECEPEQTPSGSEGHQAGLDCLTCHAGMTGPYRWTVAGTLYSDSSGSAPVSGATIVISDAGGNEIKLVTHPNGNFYTNEAVEFPLGVAASRCPDHMEMASSVTNGGCNSCHGSSFRIHLP